MYRSSLKSEFLTIEVRISNGYKSIPIHEIVFIKAHGKTAIIHLSDGSEILSMHLLKWFEKTLPEYCFFRAHNSYIVSCYFIYSYTYNAINLKINITLPLTRCKLNELRKHMVYFYEYSSKFSIH
jgi:DNA-binding LytR/AlgR family response regulator